MKAIQSISNCSSVLKSILIFLALFIPFNSLSQNLNFTHLTINDGLSQNTVYAIFQDKTGFVWLGTEDGLNRFDGYEFKIYRHVVKDPKSISSSQVNSIYEDDKGQLWIGTALGLDIFDRKTETFTHVYNKTKTSSSAFVTSVHGDSEGNIWMGTYEGLRSYDPRTGKFRSYKLSPSSLISGKSTRTYSILIDKNKTVWAGYGSDILRVNSKNGKILPDVPALISHSDWGTSTIRAIIQDLDGNIWFSTENSGLFFFDSKKNTCRNYTVRNSSIISNTIRDIYVKSKDEIWIGSRDGLSIYNVATKKFSNYTYDKYNNSSLSHNSIRCFMKDNAGSLWLGTYAGGVNISHASSYFSAITEQLGYTKGLNHRVTSSIVQTSEGNLWIGTEGGGLNFYNKHKAEFTYYLNGSVLENNPKNIIKALAEEANGNLWVGTFNGLSYFDVKTRTYKNYELPNKLNLPSNDLIYALATDGNGVWAGTNGGGLSYIDKIGTFKNYIHADDLTSISSNNITSLINISKEKLWIGTENGLCYLNKNSGEFYSYLFDANNPQSINNNSVLSLFTDSKARLWVGTKGGGLNLYDGNKSFYVIDDKLGLTNNVIHAILEDRAGNIWVSTNRGISKISFDKFLLPFTKQNIQITNYTITDGLQSNQFSAASETGKDGALYFGGINGINYFYPDKIITNTFKPKVVITDFLIRNSQVRFGKEGSPLKVPISETKEIILDNEDAFITFKFASLNFINADKNQYAYKLEGLRGDDEWDYVGNQRTATYTNLDAGKYLFKVKSANNDGVWNDHETRIVVRVLPPLWKTWWAYLIYASLIGVLLYFFYYYSYKTARLKSELDLEHLSRKKDQELTQRKLSFFTNISHEIKTPLTLILAPLEKLLSMNEGNNKVQNQLMLMQRNGERLLKLINQLLDFRKFETGSMDLQAAEGNIVRFVREVVFAFNSYAAHRQIDLVVNTESKSIRAWFDRDKFEKILYNILSNALKFTRPGGQIAISVKTRMLNETSKKGFAIIEIQDTGKGISDSHIEKIFEQFNHYDDTNENPNGTGIGLAFTKGLVELHHGIITVKSTEETKNTPGCTCFTIAIPLGKEHLKEDEIISNYKNSENITAYHKNENEETTSFTSLKKRKKEILDDAEKERLIMLVVEDNTDVRQFISSHFEEDFEIHTAENGLDGWQTAITIIPDIIISDVMMPEMSGTVLCSKLKSDARTSHIPVILLTARTPLIFKIEGLETGADDYITKPFNLSILETRIWNLLDSRKKLRERYRKEITLQPHNIAITSPDEKFLEKVMDFIEKNMGESNLSVEELGKEVNMSRVTLYRKIKALTNQTAVEFIRSVRLKRAAQLLEQNKFNISEVSYMVGFIDVDYFRKCFKKQFGHTPKEYAISKST